MSASTRMTFRTQPASRARRGHAAEFQGHSRIELSSLLGQRTVAVVLMIVLEVILTPLALRAHLPHLVNLQRAVIGAATAHVELGGLPRPSGGGGGQCTSAEAPEPVK